MSYEFKPTDEQKGIISAIYNSVADYTMSFEEEPRGKRVVTKASAGTGKTSTIIFSLSALNALYQEDGSNEVEDIVANSPKTLYLVLNADMRTSMAKTIKKVPTLPNVEVATFHKFMLDHLKKTFPEIEAKIDYKKSSLSKQDIKNFTDALFKGAFGFKRRENRIPHTTIINALDRYINLFLTSDALKSEEMNTVLKRDIKFNKIWQRRDDIEETEDFLKPYANILYDKIYMRNPQKYAKIFETENLTREEMSQLQNFTKMIGHFFTNKLLDINSDIPITHDVYFKMAYLDIVNNKKDLFSSYVAIYVDEAQDLDPMTIKILDSASPTVAYFGDSDQQLYAFKGSVDSLRIVEDTNADNVDVLSLTESFRYRHDVAVFASILLNELKDKNIKIQGRKTKVSNTLDRNLIETSSELYGRAERYREELSNVYKNASVRRRQKIAVISRTNENVLKNTLEFLRYKEDSGSQLVCSIEGSFKKKIKDAIKGKYPDELLKRLNTATNGNIENMPLSSYRENEKIVEILSGGEYSFLIDKKLSVADLELLANSRMGEATSDILFLSAHQSKGKEFTYVILDNDYFVSIKENESLYDLKQRMSATNEDKNAFDDEVNIAYVSITRPKHSLMFYKQGNPLYSFFQEAEERIENEMNTYERVEYFNNGYAVKYAKGKDGNGKEVYTKEVSDPFENVEFYEMSYEKPNEKNSLTMDEENFILKNTVYENGIEINEYKFMDSKVFKKESELTQEESQLINGLHFQTSSEVEYAYEKKNEKIKIRQEQKLF